MSAEFSYLQHLDYKDVAKAFGWAEMISQRDLADFLDIHEATLSQMSRPAKSRKKRLLMMLGLRMMYEKGIIELDNKAWRNRGANLHNSNSDTCNN